jgi:hypothetical protein
MSMKLDELEDRLRQRTGREPGGDLRKRVMIAVTEELAAPVRPVVGHWDDRYWAVAAAGVLIVLNLSMMWASQDQFSVRPAQNPHQMPVELQAIQQLETQQEGILK